MNLRLDILRRFLLDFWSYPFRYSNDLLKSNRIFLQLNTSILYSCTISFRGFNNNGDNAPSKMFLENDKLLSSVVTISILIEFYNVGKVRFNVSNEVF